MLTKSGFMNYLQCPKALWLYKHRKDLIHDDSDISLVNQGREVESYAYKLFPGGVFVDDNKINIDKTKELINKKTPTIFQPSFSGNNLFCQSDIVEYNKEKDAWSIIEIKSSTQIHDRHYKDVAFQKICLQKSGIKVHKIYLMYINNQYIKNGDIDLEKLFIKEDVTDIVQQIEKQTEIEINNALQILTKQKCPNIRILRQCDNPYKCDFIDYCLGGIAEDSIYTISTFLGEKKLAKLLDKKIDSVKDIPEDILSTKKLKMHQYVVKNNIHYIEKDNIKKELQKIEYPIHFLDYETYHPAIPMFDGFSPYQKIVFQYSLHIIQSVESEIEHYYFLANNFEDPTYKLSKSLANVMHKKGTFISWNKKFEMGCNREMGERVQEFKDFYNDINSRMYDLMDIFKNSYYVHKDFHCRASLKKVLPVIVPYLSYANLSIQEGMIASNNWGKMVKNNLSKQERDDIYNNLLEYCKLDTLAMVKILNKLREI